MIDKVYFFFTKLNNHGVYKSDLESQEIFNEKKSITVNGEEKTKYLGFNHAKDARIAQLFFANGRVQYHYILKQEEALKLNYPLVFLICDNQYRKETDDLLDSLFINFSDKMIYCYFHENNSSIKQKVLNSFKYHINDHKAFHHEKDNPFLELVSLIGKVSEDEFTTKIQKIQDKYLRTNELLREREYLGEKLKLVHKILGQSFLLRDDDHEKIQSFISKDFIYQHTLKGFILLRSHLLTQIH